MQIIQCHCCQWQIRIPSEKNLPGHFSWEINFSWGHWSSIAIAKTASLNDLALKRQSRNKAAPSNKYVLEHQTSVAGPNLIQNCVDNKLFLNVFQLWQPLQQIILINNCEPFCLYSLGSKTIVSRDTKFLSKTLWDHIWRNPLL